MKNILAVLLTFIAVSIPVISQSVTNQSVTVTNQSVTVTNQSVTVSVGAGESWKASPQFAIWLEDVSGNYIRTLYVTKKAAKKSFIFSLKDGRPESLPVWYAAAKNDIPAEQKTKSKVDAVTSATPKGGVIFNVEIEEECVIKAEFNMSFDYNEVYTKKNSGVNGQPSVVYSALLPAKFEEEIKLDFVGTGSLEGKDGKIQYSTVGLTSALSIVKAVIVKKNNR